MAEVSPEPTLILSPLGSPARAAKECMAGPTLGGFEKRSLPPFLGDLSLVLVSEVLAKALGGPSS